MTEQEQSRPAGRRKLLVTLAAVGVVAAALVAVVQLGPGEQAASVANTSAAPAPPPPPSEAPAAPAEQKVSQPPQTPAQQVPNTPGSEFDAWVGKVAGWLDIPPRAMSGYAKTTVTMTKEQPNCHLSWVTLAAIGRVTTNHGRATGAALGDDGTMAKPIGTLEVKDFYGKVVSTPNASGPMQLSPALWKKWGKGNAQNIDDASLATGRALCDGGLDLTRGEAWWKAVSTLQGAPLFLHRVLATANVYGTVGRDAEPPKPPVLKAVNFAIEKIGLPYVWGGNGEEKGDLGFDCSGLTTAAYGSAGITLKRTAHWQYGSVPLIPSGSDPRLGDLIFYGNPATKIHHVGIYIGNQQMIDAPTFGQAVQVHTYRKPGDDYAGAGRPAA
ncbi:NlpC/P60 family protein [Amycolatopsis anabasis]|uniref:C40 family peptidase n=1 Tax=Amycolatopsis anabasis TaxID=1840409 RepID=UPI00131E13A6|nr:C40 family peptidase [Amycolatopsis anabasis]